MLHLERGSHPPPGSSQEGLGAGQDHSLRRVHPLQGVKAQTSCRFCSSCIRLFSPLVMWLWFQRSLLLGAKGPRLISPEIICGAHWAVVALTVQCCKVWVRRRRGSWHPLQKYMGTGVCQGHTWACLSSSTARVQKHRLLLPTACWFNLAISPNYLLGKQFCALNVLSPQCLSLCAESVRECSWEGRLLAVMYMTKPQRRF